MRLTIKQALPGLVCLALVLAVRGLLSGGRTIYGDPTGEVPMRMPDRLGPWTGEDIWFCLNDQCARSFPASDLTNGVAAAEAAALRAAAQTQNGDGAAPPPDRTEGVAEKYYDPVRKGLEVAGTNSGTPVCPVCGGPLSTLSLGEINLLPTSTPVFRHVYHRPGHPDVVATVVFSGMERRSIHRPQVCLVGQGNRIQNEFSRPTRTDAEGRADAPRFPLRVLELVRPIRDPATGKTVSQSASVYAYWLFNPECETESHYARFGRMMVDNCFRNYRPRWGYASIAIAVDPRAPDAWEEELDGFLPWFYPEITRVRALLDANRNVGLRLEGSSADANVYQGTNVQTAVESK